MEKKDYFYIITIAILILFLSLNRCTNNTKPFKDPYTYKTDTVYIDKGYKEILERLNKIEKRPININVTPPKVITYYNTPNPENITIEKIPDSLLLYIGELKEKLAISDKYIKNYPKADKLIDFKLTRDNFNIATLEIEGNTKKQEYPMYLDQYNYVWSDNKLNHYKRKKPFKYKDPNRWRNLYFDAGYDYFNSSPKIGFDYHLKIGSFRLKTQSSILIKKDPTIYGDITLGYRLFKNKQ